MPSTLLDEKRLRRIGAWVGGGSTLLITGLLPSPAWCLSCLELRHGWHRGSQIVMVLSLLFLLAWVGQHLGQALASSLVRASWWAFAALGCVSGVVMSFASGMALMLGITGLEAVRCSDWNGSVCECLVGSLAVGAYGLFIGLPWGLLTSLVIRLWGRSTLRVARAFGEV